MKFNHPPSPHGDYIDPDECVFTWFTVAYIVWWFVVAVTLIVYRIFWSP